MEVWKRHEIAQLIDLFVNGEGGSEAAFKLILFAKTLSFQPTVDIEPPWKNPGSSITGHTEEFGNVSVTPDDKERTGPPGTKVGRWVLCKGISNDGSICFVDIVSAEKSEKRSFCFMYLQRTLEPQCFALRKYHRFSPINIKAFGIVFSATRLHPMYGTLPSKQSFEGIEVEFHFGDEGYTMTLRW